MRDDSVAQSFSGGAQRKRRIRWLAVLVRSIFGGMFVQAFRQGLRIEHNKFVTSPAISQSQEIRPGEIIARERRLRFVSAILTVTSARGMAVCYGFSFPAARVMT